MDEIEVPLGEVVSEVGPVEILEEMIVEKEVERMGDLGDSLDQEKEELELGQNQAPHLDQIQELVQIGTESSVLNVGNIIILLMNVQI